MAEKLQNAYIRRSRNVRSWAVTSHSFSAMENGSYGLRYGVCGVDAAALGLYALYLVRRHRKMRLWREQLAA